jgi:hypothetical protein
MGLETAGSQKDRGNVPNLEKDRFGGIIKNARKHGVRSRGWRTKESHSDASQMLSLPKKRKYILLILISFRAV